MIDPVNLALDLVRFDTVSPPGNEDGCAAYLADILTDVGLEVSRHAFASDRTSLIARLRGSNVSLDPLVFTGHLDTVPLGGRLWTYNPLGEISEGRLYGRGASDADMTR